MAQWKAGLEVLPDAVRLLITSPEGDDVFKARLPGYPDHPRALLTVLEGLALWCGEPLDVAIFAATGVSHSLGLGPFSDSDTWPVESALVHFEFVDRARRGRRIHGLGDFDRLRRLGIF
jgi:hypothetical protein